MTEGWIKLNRQLTEHWLWTKFPFSYGQAWVDLLLLANHEDSKMSYKGEVIVCKKGTVNRSISFLANRWRWDRKTVRRFLSLLETDEMVTVNATTHRTTITIENWDFFQDIGTTERATKRTTKSQQDGQQSPTYKKEKNEKNNIYIFHSLVVGKNITPELQEKLSQWMEYKQQRKEKYVETGMKSFLTQMEKAEAKYGTAALCNCIDTCMGRQYKGIILDLIDKEKGRGTTNVEPTVRRYPDAIECNITPEEVGTTPRYYNGIE